MTPLSSTIARATLISAIYAEFVEILTEARWLFLIIIVCVLADFRFGRRESSSRYTAAAERADTPAMETYRWHKSRAIRRTLNKLFDYVMFVSLGIAVGQGLLVPLGLERILGGVALTAVIVFCEVSSILGHFLYLHGSEAGGGSLAVLRRFLTAYLRRKDTDAGDALDEALGGEKHSDIHPN